MLTWAAIRRWGQKFSGWLLLYAAVGGFFGFFVGAKTSDCMPFVGVFGVIGSSCSNEAVDLFWLITLGIPRLLIITPACFIALLKAASRNWSSHELLNSLHWATPSILLALLAWPGFRFWRTKSRIFAIGLAISLVVEVVALAMIE